MAKYLDGNGLLYFWQKIKNRFVEQETGKGLSTNDYTSAEKTKLAGIQSGAEVNVNADWDAASGDAQILNKPSNVSAFTNDVGYAKLASPVFTGTPTAPTATAGTNTTQIATTAFVASAVASAVSGTSVFQGTVNSNTSISGSNYKCGYYWVVATAGTYVGQTCEVGDMIYAIADKSASYSAADFSVVQANLDIASVTNAEIDTIVAS